MSKDPELEKLIKEEIDRQENTIDLIASENMASKEVLQILGTPLSNKYSEGYPGSRYYPGNRIYDQIERLAQKRALEAFSLDGDEWAVNVQPYSGSPANMAVYLALVKPGEKTMGMSLSDGGHLTHGHKVSATGKIWNSVQYGVNKRTGLIDYGEVRKLAEKEKPKIIISGFTAYPREVDFEKFGEIARDIGAYHIADISHIAGLIIAGVHEEPFSHADIVTTTTHKSLRGPRGAVIFIRKNSKLANERGIDLVKEVDKAVFPGLQGGPHNNVIAAKARAFLEAIEPDFKEYGIQIVKNARVLAEELKKLGLSLVSEGTDTHLILIDVSSLNLDGLEAEKRLEKVGIIANRNSIPGDTSPLKPSGIRIGTPTITSRGFKEEDMGLLASLVLRAINKEEVEDEVISLCKKYPAKRFL